MSLKKIDDLLKKENGKHNFIKLTQVFLYEQIDSLSTLTNLSPKVTLLTLSSNMSNSPPSLLMVNV